MIFNKKYSITEDFFDDIEDDDIIDNDIENISGNSYTFRIFNEIWMDIYKFEAIKIFSIKKYFRQMFVILSNMRTFDVDVNTYEVGFIVKDKKTKQRDVIRLKLTDDIDKAYHDLIMNFEPVKNAFERLGDMGYSSYKDCEVSTIISIDYSVTNSMNYYTFSKDVKNIMKCILSYSKIIDSVVQNSPDDKNECWFAFFKNNGEMFAEMGNTGLPMEMWNRHSMNVLYNRVVQNEDFIDDMGVKNGAITNSMMTLQLFRICHNLVAKMENNPDFEYKLYGYLKGGGVEDAVYINLKAINPDKFTCKDYYDFVKTNICDKLTINDKLEIANHISKRRVNIYIVVGNEKPQDDKKNHYTKKIDEWVTTHHNIVWNFIMLNNKFGRVNRGYTAMVPEQLINCGNAMSEYKDDILAGMFGKVAKLKLKNDDNK